MAIATYFYAGGLVALVDKKIDYVNDDMRGALVGSGYTPNQDTHDFWDDVVANEITGTGYTANGLALTTKSRSTAQNVLSLLCDPLVWPSSTLNARYLVIYDRTPASDAARPLLLFVDFGQVFSSSAGAFTAAPAGGVLATLTATNAPGLP